MLPVALFSSLLVPRLAAQGKQEDYERAQQFLPGNLRHVLYIADVNPHWIQKTSRFWYRKSSPGGNEFILVDSERDTAGPAFDHARLAAGLSHANKQEYSPSDLPFREFEFVDDGKAIRRRWDYFVQHLLGVTPPANFEIKEDREPERSRRRRR